MHPCGDFTEEGFAEPDPFHKHALQRYYNKNGMCIDDNDKYKLFGARGASSMGTIQLEVTPCDPSARADPSSCNTDEDKLREFIDRFTFTMYLVTNFNDYDTHSY